MRPKNRRVVATMYDGLCTFEFAIVVETFALPRPELKVDWYDFAACSIDSVRPARATGGVRFMAPKNLGALRSAGTIVIPGWNPDIEPPQDLLAALRRAHARGARLMSICSGVFVLAATGLLDGKRATTHWRYADALRARYPRIRVEPDVLYVDEGSILTSAGSAAGIDLCLHVVRRDYGSEIANTVARRMVVPPHREGGQAQYVRTPMPLGDETTLAPLMEWAIARLGRKLTVERLAREAKMSLRTFARRFSDETGTTPHHWLIQQRLVAAQQLLEKTNRSIDAVAEAAGFETPETLRHHFRKHLHTTPTAYRKRFTIAPS